LRRQKTAEEVSQSPNESLRLRPASPEKVKTSGRALPEVSEVYVKAADSFVGNLGDDIRL
jgi:hypothetical protein